MAALLCQRGDEVMALQRPTADVSFLTALGCRMRAGNVLDPPELIARAAD
ncbi:MAG: hypothetical protein HY701_00320, partial [Gemmatimonadetes bacterium]|nr:hypothetical protein [Gemmatimonadota bacterium]